MRLLLYQDVYETTARFLIDLGHDVTRASELGLARADERELLSVAQELERVFVTRDRDYGALVFVQKILTGVLYLRMTPLTQAASFPVAYCFQTALFVGGDCAENAI